nr:MAG TPA: protein of unknown function (DUF4355) [Caudoviricetes sp.]
MNKTGQAAEKPEETEENTAEQAPWEKNGEEFDAERAKKLIAALRDENKALKAAKAEPKAEDKPAAAKTEEKTADATKAEADTAPAEPKAEDKPAAAKTEEKPPADLVTELADAKAELAKAKALAAAGLPLDFIPFIPGGDAEEIATAVDFLASKIPAAQSGEKKQPRLPVDPSQRAKVSKDPYRVYAEQIFGTKQ